MISVKNQTHSKHTLKVSGTKNVCHNDGLFIVALLLPLAVMVWSYWPTIEMLFDDWQTNDDYSAGQLVPIVVLFLLWRERKQLRECQLVPCWDGGIVLLLLAETVSLYLFLAGGHPSFERYLIMLALAGLVLLVAGRQVFRKVLWILLFLFLMVPLPGRVHNLISGPLQTMATTGSVFLLEVFVPTVSRQGNVVMLNENTPMAVAEACSGLRMLMAFIIVAAFIAYMVKRSKKQKAFILLSSIPVALICNIVRIVVTAILFLNVGSEVAEKFFHDFAGMVMMPVAVLLIFAELWLLDKIVVPEPNPQQAKSKVQPKQKIIKHRAKNKQTA